MQSTGTCTGTWISSTGTGTCNKVLVAKKKIFLCCWDAASVANSQPKYKKYGCDWFHHTLCLKFIGSNCSLFKYEIYHNFYFVQMQCNWVPIIYAQYLYWYWYLKVTYWYSYWYLKVRYWYLDHWYWYWYWYLKVRYWYLDHWYWYGTGTCLLSTWYKTENEEL